jgi:hypothetical protein
MSDELLENLRKFLSSHDAIGFGNWCAANEDLVSTATSRGTYLKLKAGNRSVAREVLQQIDPCAKCSNLPWRYPDEFVSSQDLRQGFFEALKALESAARRGVLECRGGAFACCTCGATREYDLPDREFTGEIRTVG